MQVGSSTLAGGESRELLAVYALSRTLGLAREIGVAVAFGTTLAADRLAAGLVVANLAHGAFDGESAGMTVAALDGLAIGIAATSIALVLYRAMQAVLPLGISRAWREPRCSRAVS